MTDWSFCLSVQLYNKRRASLFRVLDLKYKVTFVSFRNFRWRETNAELFIAVRTYLSDFRLYVEEAWIDDGKVVLVGDDLRGVFKID